MTDSTKLFSSLHPVIGAKAASRCALACLGFVLLLTGCSVGQLPNSNRSQLCGAETAEITAQRNSHFDVTLRQVLLAQTSCKECHDGRSGKAPYPHSSTDLVEAYAATLQLVEPLAPTSSRLVVKMGAGHQCGNPSQCQALAAAMVTEIQKWATAEEALPPPPNCNLDLVTGLAVALPGKLVKFSNLSPSSPTVLRWDLTASHPELGQMLFSVNARAFTAPSVNGPGSYVIDNLIFATAKYRVKVVSVLPTINGRIVPRYANYAGVNFVVAQQPFDGTASVLGFRPLPDGMQLNFADATAGDELGFSLLIQETSEPATTTTSTPTCKSPAKFKLVYDNVFDSKILVAGKFVGQCTQCHGDPTQAANAVMDLSGNGVDPCLQVLMRSDLASPFNSLLLLKPSLADVSGCQNAGLQHPEPFLFVGDCKGNPPNPTLAAQKNLILDWLNDEAAKQQ